MIVALTQWIRVSSPLSKVTLYYTHVRSLHYFGGSGGVIPYRGSYYKVASQSMTNLLFVYTHLAGIIGAKITASPWAQTWKFLLSLASDLAAEPRADKYI